MTGYTASAAGGGTCTGGAAATSCTISGLTTGQAYSVTVAATNGIGGGPTP